MKKNIFTFILFVCCVSLSAQEYILNGKVSDPAYKDGKVYLQEIDKGDIEYSLKNLDSTTVNNGSFSFRGAAETLDIRVVSLSPPEKSGSSLNAIFITEPGTINIMWDPDSVAIINGSAENEKHTAFIKKVMEIFDQINSTLTEFLRIESKIEPSREESRENDEKYREYKRQLAEKGFKYIKNNINNKVGEFYLIELAERLDEEQIIELYKLSNPEFQESEPMKSMMAEIASSYQNYRGGMFEDVELITPDKEKVMISNYLGKGKVVLINFWESGCSLSQEEIPKLIELYNEYQDKDFDILGISLDENLSKWTRAIKKMNMTWPSLCDPGGWNSKIVDTYDVGNTPQSFLVDKKGNIVAYDLEGRELRIVIENLLRQD